MTPTPDKDKKKNVEFYAPFWLVSPTTDVTKATMVFELVTVELDGKKIDVPTLVNHKVVKKGQSLAFFRQSNATKYPKMIEFKNQSGGKKRRLSA